MSDQKVPRPFRILSSREKELGTDTLTVLFHRRAQKDKFNVSSNVWPGAVRDHLFSWSVQSCPTMWDSECPHRVRHIRSMHAQHAGMLSAELSVGSGCSFLGDSSVVWSMCSHQWSVLLRGSVPKAGC